MGYSFKWIYALDESNRKPNKIRIDKVNEFYNRSMKQLLQNNDIDKVYK